MIVPVCHFTLPPCGPDRGRRGAINLLIVEDEPKTAAYLRKGLFESGYSVQTASDGNEGLALAREGTFDLVILDVGLPGRDGWSILQALRRDGLELPVLFLTARDGVPDRVKGLELGADDYLVKPFAFPELLARVKTLLRRPTLRPSEPMAIADLAMDLARSDARRGGLALGLTRQEFLLLSLLVSRKGEVLSRSYIARQVWQMNVENETNAVDVAIRRLRRKVDEPFETKLIHTARGLGYRLDVE